MNRSKKNSFLILLFYLLLLGCNQITNNTKPTSFAPIFSIDLNANIFKKASINKLNLFDIKYRGNDTIFILYEVLQNKIYEYSANEKNVIDSFAIPRNNDLVFLISYKSSDSITYIDCNHESPALVLCGKTTIYKRFPFGVILNNPLIAHEFHSKDLSPDQINYFFLISLKCNDSNFKTYCKDKYNLPGMGKFHVFNDTLRYNGLNIRNEFRENLLQDKSVVLDDTRYTFKNQNTFVYIHSLSNNVFEYDLSSNISKKTTIKNSQFIMEPIYYLAASKNNKGESMFWETANNQSFNGDFFYNKKYGCYFRKICVRKENELDRKYLEILDSNFEVKSIFNISENEGMCHINDEIYFKVKDRKKKTITYEKLSFDRDQFAFNTMQQ